MSETLNTITIGNYKKCVIMLKGEKDKKPVLICKSLFRKRELPMDKTTIRTLNHTFLGNKEHEVIIEWEDGTLSQAIVDDVIYSAILRNMVTT